MTIQPYAEPTNVTNPVNRIRWATQRVSGPSGRKKRLSIMDRFHRGSVREKRARQQQQQHADSFPEEEDGPDHQDTEESHEEAEGQQRSIYFNVPLPDSAKDDEGRPAIQYSRNKIRTAKYTPLSFVPKNLYFQLHNIANIYFLFIVILQIFSIFGASNPGLGAVPIIVILTVTAIKDAIEDWRRTVLDNELNNSSVHRLVDWDNVNVSEENVSAWRRVKKATTRTIVSTYRACKGMRKKSSKKGQKDVERGLDEPRTSAGTRPTPRTSMNSYRSSVYSQNSGVEEEGIQMTPVPSPSPAKERLSNGNLEVHERPMTGFSYDEESENYFAARKAAAPTQELRKNASASNKAWGNVINPNKPLHNAARFKKDYWKNVQVGDFVRIYNEDEVPADCVILSTSDPDGACYVETKNLDGETNLKVRQSLRCGRHVKHARDCARTEFLIESEPPHSNLYQYNGVIRWNQIDTADQDVEPVPRAEPISVNNLLLRGCSLRNTEWVLAIVVFTGEETKIMLNSGMTPTKRTRIARDLNWNVIYNFIILFLMCFICAIVNGVTWGQGHNSLDFFEFGSIGGTPALNGFVTFWTVVILFQNLVPISLFITLEIIKTAQAFFIWSDTFMYYEKIDYPCTPKSWNISDDLGQIEYIFSDKTGTLTQNVMEFKKCTINGVPYGEAYTEALAGMRKREGVDVEEEGERMREQIAQDRVQMLAGLRKMHDNPYLVDDQLTFVAPDYVAHLAGENGEEQSRANEHFMLALALCHTVVTERTPGDPPKIEFKAQSPDEAALVATARDCGFTVLGRRGDEIMLNIMGEERSYTILNTLEFNSSRKRMSAIVRMPDGKIVLFCKGADSIIWSRLRRGEQAELRESTKQHLEMFAREGLRTLCVAQRELNEDEYYAWNKKHEVAAAAVQDREEKLEKISDEIERQLLLLGGTAIEDRLQDGVPETIALLAEAGIKLWVLTGDKVETAINIGFSCNLLNNDMNLIVVKADAGNPEAVSAELEKHLSVFGMTGSDAELAAAKKDHGAPGPTHAIVIDGDSLKVVLEEQYKQQFLLLCKQCKSVLCCRVSPSQKAAVVQMVKRGLDVMTLSIGDGANDVAMIQEADVGVGIAGEEGRQAAMSSDYAIGQFRFLQRLVLVHGRWSYRRIGETIANFFYKNIVWTFTLFWYMIYNNFDGSYLFEYTYILLYNLAFTSIPIILLGVLDQDVSDKVSLAVPQLYRRGIQRKEWTQTKFWVYMLDGIYQSVICFYMGYLMFKPANFVTANGQNINDRQRIGIYVACATVVVANIYLLMNTYRWDWFTLLIMSISILLVWFWTGVYSAFTSTMTFYGAASEVFGQATFWAVTFLSVIICLLPRFSAKIVQKFYMPYDVDIVREQVKQGKFAYLDEKSAYTVQSNSESTASSDEIPKPAPINGNAYQNEDERPIYPPSVAATRTTHNPRSQNGSDGTEYTGHRLSLDPPVRTSVERPSRPSYERVRMSMDRMRPSFEASNDITSAAMLTRMESEYSQPEHSETGVDGNRDNGGTQQSAIPHAR
ncbi:P-type ATPase [Xylona heveae TC161]|uniref:Phospholipid-transporting ATPase n=1 Tax=Xylona heveae (strain CBS 132557 / TC161) TaxID=1328760 RepID=A0A165FCM4_XYLHT|nr:P-type ATPase [Xylona heveae TC161]KZF20825.1 P-type ATPase [Xylona heveae TC161]